MKIKRYVCDFCDLTTTRKGLRKHIADNHARNNFTKSSAWKCEEWIDEKKN